MLGPAKSDNPTSYPELTSGIKESRLHRDSGWRSCASVPASLKLEAARVKVVMLFLANVACCIESELKDTSGSNCGSTKPPNSNVRGQDWQP